MRIETASTASLGLLGRAPGMIPEWRVGAVVEAIAVRDATSGQLWLNLGHLRLPARVASGDPAGPADGEALKLKVLRNSPVLAFEALETRAPLPDQASEALRRVLPRQSSPAALLASLGALLERKDLHGQLPQRIVDSATRLWDALTPASRMSDAAGLASALGRSGLFMENRLATASGTALRNLPLTDLKALLLGLREALSRHELPARSPPAGEPAAPLPLLGGSFLPLPAQSSSLATTTSPAIAADTLARDTDGALARLTATQLINTAAGGLAWLVEIPVRHENEARMLRFRFEHETARDEGEQPGWTVEAALELGNRESVHARVSLRQRRISVLLRSDAPHLVARLKAHAGQLQQALEVAGLNVDQVLCLHGLPVDDAGQPRARLVDMRA